MSAMRVGLGSMQTHHIPTNVRKPKTMSIGTFLMRTYNALFRNMFGSLAMRSRNEIDVPHTNPLSIKDRRAQHRLAMEDRR
jgi:hypothetical protein